MYKIFFLDPMFPSFPSPEEILNIKETLIGFGGYLSVPWLKDAYHKGFFPWFNPGGPITWWNPNPRALMKPQDIRLHKSMRPYINQVKFRLRIDYAFTELLERARQTHLKNHGNTWLSDQFIEEYTKLHKMGFAHSFEAWKDGELVGGLYGESWGKMFFGEAMFSAVPNASKFCFIAFARTLEINDFNYIDCQIQNPHLEFMGCREVERETFLAVLMDNRKYDTARGDWSKIMKIPAEFEKHFLPND